MLFIAIAAVLLLSGGGTSSSSTSTTPGPQPAPTPPATNAGDVIIAGVGAAMEIYRQYLANSSKKD